jgi:hypothetical protein
MAVTQRLRTSLRRAHRARDLTARTKYKYEFYISKLDAKGTVRGRFRGDAQNPCEEKDPEWWLVRGYSDGKTALLSYTDDDGKVLGKILLTQSVDKRLWIGQLVGVDRSISDKGFVQSPVMIARHDYDLLRIKGDMFLDQPSVLQLHYTK